MSGTVPSVQAPAATGAVQAERDYVSLVNPWVESDIGRYFFFQSASNPFGFVKLRPDAHTASASAGYGKQSPVVKGFSHVHDWQLSGVQVMPTTGDPVPKLQGDAGWQSPIDHTGEIAEPGYHKLHLDRYDVTAELTVTDRVGLHRYTYDEAGPSEVIINLGGQLGESIMKHAKVTRVSADEVAGYVRQAGWGSQWSTLYFDIQFERPFDSLHGWSDGSLMNGGGPVHEVSGDNMGVYARYNHLDAGDQIQMKVGLSLTGVDGARRNIAAELPGWDFESVKAASQQGWNDMLGRIDVQGGTEQQQVKFYTDLFHVLCGRSIVSDADGKYLDNTWGRNQVKQIPLDRDGTPRFGMYNYDALWLTQWNLNTVLGLAYPQIYSSLVKSQLQMYRDGGLLPRGPVGGDDSFIMTSSPVTSFIAGAYNKGIRDFDVDLAYDAMLDAQSVGGLYDKGWNEYSTWTDAGGSRAYLDKGYVPAGSQGAGKTLEYAFQDWTLAQLAQTLDKNGINATQYADVAVSSQRNNSNFAGERAIDGRPIRSSISPSENVEWQSAGQQNPWIELSWDEPRRLKYVILSDRANQDSNVNAGRLEFGDGSTVTVDDIPVDGSDKVVQFPPREVDSVRFAVTGGEGTNVGLNEIEVWDSTNTYRYLLDRSRNWRNLFDEQTGFIRPRNADGSWIEDFDPLAPRDFVEANSWQATWFTSHDVMGLANLMGGEAAYADKLNYAFRRSEPARFFGSYGEGFVSYGNQPGLQVAHLFNYVRHPWLSQYWVRQVKEKTYGSIATDDGYGHHDEDQGQMGAMSALMAMGLFEVTGGGLSRPVYDITSPVFDEITIELNQDYYSGKQFRIVTHDNSAENMYIQRAELDGRDWDNAWFRHDQLVDGGTLELWMGPEPNQQWGIEELPPSESKPEGEEPVYATDLAIEGPDHVDEPYDTVEFEPQFTPSNTTFQKAFWSVTAPDGSPTDVATITDDGLLTVNHRAGEVLITAVNADGGPRVEATKTVAVAPDPALLRGNAARWPGVTATASSEYSDGYAAEKAIDGVTSRPDGGDWASAGEQNPWIQLDWAEPIQADRIVLYDRAGIDDVNGGTLTFSDGSSVKVTDIPPAGGAKEVRFDLKTFNSVRLQVEGGTGPNNGLSEFEVYAVPSVPDAPRDVAVVRDGNEATVSWNLPAFDGGAPITGYVVKAYRDGEVDREVTLDETTTQTVVTGLSADASSYAFTVAAVNMVGTGAERSEPVLATGIEIVGPRTIEEPYGSTRFEGVFTPEDTTLKKALWSVTEPDGAATDKATIDSDGVLTVNHRSGDVIVTATAADTGAMSTSITVTVDPDPALLRTNAARWPGVTATASSQYDANYGPARAHDGFGTSAGEWASSGEQNPWIQLQWDRPIRADKITLFDRRGVDNANGGTLSFSDGTTVQVSGIPVDGSGKPVTFPQKSFQWVRFQVADGSGPNVGLAEFEVYAVPSTPDVPAGVSATAGPSQATVRWTPPAFDGGAPVTGYVVTPYRNDVAMEPTTVDVAERSVVVSGLTIGQAYEFTVSAVNIMGTGPESAPTEPVVPS